MSDPLVIFVIRNNASKLYMSDEPLEEGSFADAKVFEDGDEVMLAAAQCRLLWQERFEESRLYFIRKPPKPIDLEVVPIAIPEAAVLQAEDEAEGEEESKEES